MSINRSVVAHPHNKMSVTVVTVSLSMSALILIVTLACLLQKQTRKARQYKTACTDIKRVVMTKRAELIEIVNRERARHKVSKCTCARYALHELRQTVLTDILAPLTKITREIEE